MTYLNDHENPFGKIWVQDGLDMVGVIRRNLKTCNYQFYYNQIDSIIPLFKADRLDKMKSWVKTQYAA